MVQVYGCGGFTWPTQHGYPSFRLKRVGLDVLAASFALVIGFLKDDASRRRDAAAENAP